MKKTGDSHQPFFILLNLVTIMLFFNAFVSFLDSFLVKMQIILFDVNPPTHTNDIVFTFLKNCFRNVSKKRYTN